MQGSNIAATFQCMSVRSASYLSAGTAFSSPSSCIGLVRSDGSAFYSKTAPQYKVHCSFPASKPASLITLGFHTLPDHNTYLPSTSPQLRCLQLEMTITCSVIVGCLFFSLCPPPASRVILCWSAGLKETTFCHGK